MSGFRNTPKTCNILDTSNGDISQEHSGNYTECISSIDKDVILLPVDGGQQAWTFMIGAFMIEGLMWGFPLAFGVFQSYYQNNHTFANSQYLSLVGTLTTAISYLGTPLITLFTIKYPMYQRQMIWGGWFVCIFALVGSSFAIQVWHLMIAQGFLYGFGFLTMYYPLLNMLNEWFVRRRGLAYGILFGSSGICGLGLPFIIEKMLKQYGYAVTLRVYAIAIFILVGPILPLLRGRLVHQANTNVENKLNLAIFKEPKFLAVTCSNFFQGLVFFLPSVYLPSYASATGLSPSQGTLLLSILNVSQIIGQISMGFLSDRFEPIIPMVGSTLYSSAVVLFAWRSSESFTSLLIFCLLYGLFAGGYSVLYCRFVTALTDRPDAGLWLYSIFEFQRGIGNLIGGSVSGILMTEVYTVQKYENLILFIGIAFSVSSVGGMSYWGLRWYLEFLNHVLGWCW